MFRRSAIVSQGANSIDVDMTKAAGGIYLITAVDMNGDQRSINFVKL